MCNEVAYSNATGLIYSNVEWVNSVDTLLHFPHPAKGTSPPGRFTGGRLVPRRANERSTSEPAALARLGCQAYHRHPGRTCLSPLLPQLAHS